MSDHSLKRPGLTESPFVGLLDHDREFASQDYDQHEIVNDHRLQGSAGDGRFRRKTVIVTGGSSGIGLATAKAFAARGADVAIIARDEGRLVTAGMKPFGMKVSVVCPPDVDTPGLANEKSYRPAECDKVCGSIRAIPRNRSRRASCVPLRRRGTSSSSAASAECTSASRVCCLNCSQA